MQKELRFIKLKGSLFALAISAGILFFSSRPGAAVQDGGHPPASPLFTATLAQAITFLGGADPPIEPNNLLVDAAAVLTTEGTAGSAIIVPANITTIACPAPTTVEMGCPIPTSFSAGCPQPTSVALGCPAPTTAAAGCPIPTSISAGCPQPTTVAAGCPTPTTAAAGCITPTTVVAGCPAPTTAAAGCNTPTTAAGGCDPVPFPSGKQIYVYPHVYSPIEDTDPSFCRPFAVGNVDGGTLSLQVGLMKFDAPVDVYLLLFFPAIDLVNVFLIRPDLLLQTISQGVTPWKSNTSDPINEALYGDFPVELLPSGNYFLALMVTPTGRLDAYYFWMTDFAVP